MEGPARHGKPDLAPTSYREIIRSEIEEGVSQLERPATGLALSGLSAGLDIGFGPLLMVMVLTLSEGTLTSPLVELLEANAYAVGFVFVVIGRSELFTEHTTLAVIPVLNRRAGLLQLGRLWGVVYVSNLVGAAAFAAIAVAVGPALGTVDPAAFEELATGMTGYSWQVTLASGVLAGWLMGLMTWLVAAGRGTASQVFFVWLVAAVIGFAQLPHCIAGTVEVLLGVFGTDAVTVADFGGFLLWATLGNAVGGTVFVALLKYGHGVRGGTTPDEVEVRDEDLEEGGPGPDVER